MLYYMYTSIPVVVYTVILYIYIHIFIFTCSLQYMLYIYIYLHTFIFSQVMTPLSRNWCRSTNPEMQIPQKGPVCWSVWASSVRKNEFFSLKLTYNMEINGWI